MLSEGLLLAINLLCTQMLDANITLYFLLIFLYFIIRCRYRFITKHNAHTDIFFQKYLTYHFELNVFIWLLIINKRYQLNFKSI